MLTNADIAELVALRRQLHRHPELSRQEQGNRRHHFIHPERPVSDKGW